MTALASIDWRHLSLAQQRALKLLHGGAVLLRRANGYGQTGRSVTLDVAKSLQARGLVTMQPGRPLELSYGGKAFMAVRAEKQRA